MIEPRKSSGTPPEDPGKRKYNWLPWAYVIIFLFFAGQYYMYSNSTSKKITWRKFETELLERGDVERLVVVNQEKVEIYLDPEKVGKPPYENISVYNTGPHFLLTIGSVETFERKLEQAQANVDKEDMLDIEYAKRTNWMSNLLGWIVPFIIILAIWFFILRSLGTRMGGGGAGGPGIFDFGKSRARLFDKDQTSQVTFEDVAGLEEAKIEVKEIVEFLKSPERYTALGAKIPKGVILAGPPGTGKTLMAKAVAGEAKVPFFSISGSEFVEMFVGVGASRVRDLFKKAKERAPSIVFIDEIDAIGRSRGAAVSFQSNDERESTLNQLLTEMDGFGANAGVIVLAATNRPDILDKALLRPGRFDRHIYLELPSLAERQAIFKVHMRNLKLDASIDVEMLASQTPGFSGADIANICNEAALIAARKDKTGIYMEDFSEAIDRIVAGLERKSKIISPREKKTIAYHEAGHATVSWFLENADELVKVSIVPRGKALGAAWYLPEEHSILTKSQLNDRLCMALGGRASEEIIFNEISSGAIDDLEKVTKQAYTMVMYYGLGAEIGNLSFFDSTGKYEQSFQKPYSEETAQMIDKEVRDLVEAAYERTKEIIIKHKQKLIALAELLLEKEVIGKPELIKVFGERKTASETTKIIAQNPEKMIELPGKEAKKRITKIDETKPNLNKTLKKKNTQDKSTLDTSKK